MFAKLSKNFGTMLLHRVLAWFGRGGLGIFITKMVKEIDGENIKGTVKSATVLKKAKKAFRDKSTTIINMLINIAVAVMREELGEKNEK